MNAPQGRDLIERLMSPAVYDHPVDQIELLETHISWVLLTGPAAYKIKKPLQLDFLDFSSLEKRHECCEAELRLNRRLAPAIYEAVTPITFRDGRVAVSGAGEPIEYAVRMKQFQQSQLLSNAIQTGNLLPRHIDALADTVARFHQRTEVSGADTSFGDPAAVHSPVVENFEELRKGGLDRTQLQEVERLSAWSEQRFSELRDHFASRKRNGFIRECHGDMHLGNMILNDDGQGVTIFDCIEFNEHFRRVDVISEVAFCAMDLEDRGRRDYAYRFLNAYLEHTGDYSGVVLLRFYLVYFAMVRAKVARIRLAQEQADRQGSDGQGSGSSPGRTMQALAEELDAYLRLADRYTAAAKPTLLITHGVSGSGKTYGTQALLQAMAAVRLRSDIERKRLFPGATGNLQFGEGAYSEQSSERVYDHLLATAGELLAAGHVVIVDATFLDPRRREVFRELAVEHNAPFHILSFQASKNTLQKRLVDRQHRGDDASDATVEVMSQQKQQFDSQWTDAERGHVIEIDSEQTDAARQAVLPRGLPLSHS